MNLLFANDRAGEFPESFYAASRDAAPLRPALKGAHRADVCIIGAGYTGLSAALHLAEADIGRLASWWHTDADLGRPMEVMTDMGKSRKAGFLDYQDTQDAFFHLFEKLKAERVIPR